MPAEACRLLYHRGFYTPEEIGKALGVSTQAAGIRMAELWLGSERVGWSAGGRQTRVGAGTRRVTDNGKRVGPGRPRGSE